MIIKKEFTFSEEQFVTVFEDTIASTLSKPENQEKPLRSLKQRLIIFMGLFIITMLMALRGGYVTIVTASLCFGIFTLFLAYIYFYLPHCYKHMAQKMYRTSEALKNVQYIEVTPEGVVSGGEGHKTTLDWSQIYKIEKGTHNYLIFLNSSNAIGVPLEVLNDEEQAALEGYKNKLVSVST